MTEIEPVSEYVHPVYTEEEKEQNRLKDIEREKKNLEREYFLIGIPPRFIDKTFENFIGLKDKINLCRKTVLDDGQSLFVSGSTGVGKTHIAVALTKLMHQKIKKAREDYRKKQDNYSMRSMPDSYSAYFLPSVELFLKLKNSFNNEKVSEMDIIDYFSTKEFLVIDDVGSEKVSDWSRQIFYTLIDRRYRNMKQTVITSNLDLKEIADMIDSRISSRIREMGAVIKIESDDKRLKPK